MSRSPSWFSAFTLGLLIAVGCTDESGEGPDIDSASGGTGGATTTIDADDDSSADASAEEEPLQVTVVPTDAAGFQDFLETHEGKVVLVDFWATWCGPCIEQFPHTVQISQKYADSGVVVASLSCDDADDEAKVLAFLKKQQAAFPNFLSTQDLSGTFDAYDIRGGIPFYKLYDRSGKLRYEFSGAPQDGDGTESFDQIELRIKELLVELADA